MNNQQSWSKGLLAALVTFTFFGAVLPILYDIYKDLPSYKILAWVGVMAVPIMGAMVVILGRMDDLKQLMASPKKMLLSFIGISGQAISMVAFIMGMALGHALEVSLSYFVLPLFYVVIGVVFFKEKLSRLMAIALFIAIASLVFLFVKQGQVSWILPVICVGAATYSTMRKLTQVEPISGLFWEILSLLPLAIAYLVLTPFGFWPQNMGQWVGYTSITIANIIPMLGLVLCIRFLPFNMVGIVAWLAPSLTFVLSLFLWKEALDTTLLITFSGIWLSMVLYAFATLNTKNAG